MIDRVRTTPQVYVIDGNPLHRSVIAKSLRESGFEVSCHERCNEMADAYDSDRGGCLVLDYNLTGHGGILAIAYLAELGVEIPTVYVASGACTADGVAAMKAGAVDFLDKPVSAEDLVQAVQDAIQRDGDERRRRDQQAGVSASVQRLTQRERETMTLVLDGLSVKQIASRFGIGLQTAAKHRARLLDKMNVRSDAQLVRLYYSCGISMPL